MCTKKPDGTRKTKTPEAPESESSRFPDARMEHNDSSNNPYCMEYTRGRMPIGVCSSPYPRDVTVYGISFFNLEDVPLVSLLRHVNIVILVSRVCHFSWIRNMADACTLAPPQASIMDCQPGDLYCCAVFFTQLNIGYASICQQMFSLIY